MASYPVRHSDKYVMPAPAVPFRKCTRQYWDLRTLNRGRLFEILDTLEERRPAYIDMLTNDTFIARMQQQFDASILLPQRQKHMIVIFGNIDTNNTALVNKLKKYFEAQHVITDWNGQDQVDETEATLLLTKHKPPYQQPYNALSIEGAHRLLVA